MQTAVQVDPGMIMRLEVRNPNNLPLIDYRTVKPLQGELKDLSESNYTKLKSVLLKRGFKVPLFLWHHNENYYLLDGHQRQRVMMRENMQPYEVPYILIEAVTEAEAKAQLLEISSQYGTITQEGLDSFAVELPEADLVDLSFDALIQFSREENAGTDRNDNNGTNDNTHELQCPECGHVNSASAFKPVPDGELSNV